LPLTAATALLATLKRGEGGSANNDSVNAALIANTEFCRFITLFISSSLFAGFVAMFATF
jgi:hypothetical protein